MVSTSASPHLLLAFLAFLSAAFSPKKGQAAYQLLQRRCEGRETGPSLNKEISDPEHAKDCFLASDRGNLLKGFYSRSPRRFRNLSWVLSAPLCSFLPPYLY